MSGEDTLLVRHTRKGSQNQAGIQDFL